MHKKSAETRLVFVLIIMGWVVGGCAATRERSVRFEYSRFAMGGEARIVLHASTRADADVAALAAFARIEELEQTLSDWRPTSELERVVRAAHAAPVRVSEDLFDVLRRAREMTLRTNGAFDPTIGPLIALWRAARTTRTLPSAEAITAARALVGVDGLVLDERARTVRLARPGMRIDLGAIGKGYACQQALTVLTQHGIESALVEMGGDIVCSAPPPGASGWVIGIPAEHGEAPAIPQSRGGAPSIPEPLGEAQARLCVAYCAVSTSGDREQWVEIDGRRFSHVVDPRTGLGLENRARVVVIAPDGSTADALSTALSTLPIATGTQLAAEFASVEARLATSVAGERTVMFTPGFAGRTDEPFARP